MMSPTTTEPRPIRERQVRIDFSARSAELRGREESPNLDATRCEGPCGFVLNLAQELAEGRVEDGAGELGSRQSLDAQVLDADAIVLPRQIGCQLMEEVASLVRNPAMHASYATLCFLPAMATRLRMRQVLLSPSKRLATLASESRSRDASTAGEDEQVFEPEIYSYWIDWSGQLYVRDLELGSQGDVPVSGRIPLERGALCLSFYLPRLPDTNPANLRNVDLTAFDPNPLRDAKGEVSGFLRAEPREPATLLEERVESPVHVLESLLEHLAVGLFEPQRIRLALESGQLRGELLRGDALAVFGVVALAPTESPVIDETPGSGHAVQPGFLSLCWAHPEPVDLSEVHLRPRTLSFDVLLNLLLRDMTRRGSKVRRGPHRRHPRKMREVLPKDASRVALEPVDQLADRERRRCVDEHMQVVRLDSKVLNANLKLFGFLPKQSFEPVRDVSDEDLAPSARYPDEVILEHNHGAFVVSML